MFQKRMMLYRISSHCFFGWGWGGRACFGLGFGGVFVAFFCMVFLNYLLLSSAETFDVVLDFQVDKRKEMGYLYFISHSDISLILM